MATEVLITGATGFVGGALVKHLHAQGIGARALSRRPDAAKEAMPELASAHRWGGADEPLPREAVEGAAAVVHLAGETVSGRWTKSKRRAIEASRRDGTRRVVDAIVAAEDGPKTLVSASAIGYYGSRGDEELTETSSPGHDFLAHVCKVWEEEALRAEDHGVRVVRVRIGLVMGKDGGPLEAMLPLFKMGLGGKIGDGQQYWPWVHRDDLVALIARAVEDKKMKGAYNATAPTPVRQRAFADTLGRVIGRPTVVPAPAFAIKTILGGFADELLASRRVVPERALAAGFEFTYPDLFDALRAILG